MPLYPSCVHLPEWAVSQAIATGALEARKFMLERTRRIGQAWAVIYFTDQLLTPCSKYFSGASTLNGTPGGDRWARVLGGQISWLSEPLHRFEADRSGSRNLKLQTHGKHEKSRPTENTRRNPHQPSDRDHLETDREERAPHVGPYSPGSVDTRFVEIGLVQLSQLVKTTNVIHALRQTD